MSNKLIENVDKSDLVQKLQDLLDAVNSKDIKTMRFSTVWDTTKGNYRVLTEYEEK